MEYTVLYNKKNGNTYFCSEMDVDLDNLALAKFEAENNSVVSHVDVSAEKHVLVTHERTDNVILKIQKDLEEAKTQVEETAVALASVTLKLAEVRPDMFIEE